MLTRAGKLLALAALLSVAATGMARADCEADMDKLDQAMKSATLTAAAKASLEDAQRKAVEAVKKDDDATCNRVITGAMTAAGLKM